MGGRTSSYPLGFEFRAPLTIPGGDVAGAEVVRELPEAFSLAVWQALRCVVRWSAGEPGSRAALFDAAAMEDWEVELLLADWDDELRLPVAVIAGVLVDAEGASPERLARACLCVTDWGLAHGAVTTALAFAEAAALAWADQPRYAYMVGRLLRTHGRPREAEEWMKRVVRIGRRLEDREAECLGLNSLGNTYTQVGRYRDAIRWHRQALKLSRKQNFEKLEGEILHDLFVAYWAAGDHETADGYARAAFERYRSGHERLPALAHDLAYSWVVQGYHSRGLSVLEKLPGHFSAPHERLRALGSLARAAGGCGLAQIFDQATSDLHLVAAEMDSTLWLASALVEMAIGAAGLDRWTVAEDSLAQAIEIAANRSEADVLARAEETLEYVRSRRIISFSRSALDTRPLPAVDPMVDDLLASLLTEPITAAC